MYVVYAKSIGLSSTHGAVLIAILNGLSAIGRVAFGFIADRLGRLNTFLFCLLMTSLSFFGLWLPAESFAMCVLFSIAYGLFAGGYMSIFYTVVSVIFGSFINL